MACAEFLYENVAEIVVVAREVSHVHYSHGLPYAIMFLGFLGFRRARARDNMRHRGGWGETVLMEGEDGEKSGKCGGSDSEEQQEEWQAVPVL